MIEMLDIVPIMGMPYSIPRKGQDIVLATSKGTSSIFWTVRVQYHDERWDPISGRIRVEGVVTYKGQRCQIIAWYTPGIVRDILGTMQLHAPEEP